MKIKSKKFAFYLIIWILPIFIGIFSFIFFYNYYISRELLLKNVEENTRNLTSSAINKSEGVFTTLEKIAYNSSIFIKNQNYSRDYILATIQGIVSGNDEIYGSCFAYNPKINPINEKYDAPYFWKDNGKIKFKNLASDDYNYTNWDWYEYPLKIQKGVWSEPYYDEGGGETLMSTYSVPIYKNQSDNNSFIGILTVDVSLDWLNKLIGSIEIFDTGYAFLVSRNGDIIAHRDTSMVMRLNLVELSIIYKDPQLELIVNEMKQGKSGFKRLSTKFLKEPSWIYYSELENNGWDLAFVFPESELYADLFDLNRQIIIIFTIGLVLILVAVFSISRKVTQPLSEFVNLMNREGEQFINEPIPEIVTGSSEIQTLNKSFKILQSELINYIKQHNQLMLEKSKIDSELNIAKQLQQSMLPHYSESISFNGKVGIDGSLDAAREIGGDLYDFFKIDDNHLFFAIGDVSGKGIGAAIFMSMVINLQRAFAKNEGNNICRIIQKLSEHISQNNEKNFFVTLFAGILDTETGIINFVNAGHNYPIILSKNNNPIIIDKTHLPPLGIINIPVCKSDFIQLKSGDSLFLYTDGLTDATNGNGEMFNSDRVITLLKELSEYSPLNTINYTKIQINNFVQGAEQYDDITLLVLQYLNYQNIINIYESSFTAHLAEFEKQRELIEKQIDEHKINSIAKNKLILVLEEIITNIIKYGETENNSPLIELRIDFSQESLSITMKDNSAPFDYNESFKNTQQQTPSFNQIGGRGLLLVSKMVHNFKYTYSNNKNIINFEIKIGK